MAVVDRRRHQLRRFAAGVAEHDALVASAFVLLTRHIDALGDVGRLRMQQNFHVGGLPMEAVLFVADVTDGVARGLLDPLLGDAVGPTRLTGDDHAVGRRKRFASSADDPRVKASGRPLSVEQIDDLV